MKRSFVAILAIIISIVPNILLAQDKAQKDYFESEVLLNSYYDHYKKIIELTRKGWVIVTSNSHQYIEPNLSGGIFASYPEVTYILRNDKDSSTAICSVFGETGGNFNNAIKHYIKCYR